MTILFPLRLLYRNEIGEYLSHRVRTAQTKEKCWRGYREIGIRIVSVLTCKNWFLIFSRSFLSLSLPGHNPAGDLRGLLRVSVFSVSQGKLKKHKTGAPRFFRGAPV